MTKKRRKNTHPLAAFLQDAERQPRRRKQKKQPAQQNPFTQFMRGQQPPNARRTLFPARDRDPTTPFKRNPLFTADPKQKKRKPLLKGTGITIEPIFAMNERQQKRKQPTRWQQSRLTYPQARHRFGLSPIGDRDKDGVMNAFDCRPYNRRMHMADDQRKAMFARMMEEGTYDPRKYHKKGTRYTKEERKWLNWIARGRRGPSPYEKAKPYGVPPKTVEMEIKEHVADLKEKKKFLMGLDHYIKNDPARASAIRQNVDDWFRAQGKQPPPVDSYEFLFVAQSMKKLLVKNEKLWYDETPGRKGIEKILLRRADELASRGELSKSDAEKYKKMVKGGRLLTSPDLSSEKIMRITEKIDNLGKEMLTKQVGKDKSYERGREAQAILEKAREIKAKRDVQEYGGTLMQLQLSDDSWHVIKAEDLEEFAKKKNIKEGTVKQIIFGEPGPDKSTMVYRKPKGKVQKSEVQKLRERAGLTEMQQEIKAEKILEPKIKTLLGSQAKKQGEEAKKARRERIRNMRLMEKQIRREEMEERKRKRQIERERQKEKDKDPFGIKKQALSQQPSESPAARAKRLAREAKAKKESKKAKQEYRFVGDST